VITHELPEPPRSTITGDLLTLTRHELDLFDAGYASGYTAGLQRGHDRGGYEAGIHEGWRLHVRHEQAAWQAMANTIRAMNRRAPFAEVQARHAALPPVPTYEECMASWGPSGGGAT
jgi:hypothetical protein